MRTATKTSTRRGSRPRQPPTKPCDSYNRDGGLARHVFEYYGAINQPRKLLITSRERIQQAYSPLAQTAVGEAASSRLE